MCPAGQPRAMAGDIVPRYRAPAWSPTALGDCERMRDHAVRNIRVVFVGMSGVFSVLPLRGLLERGARVCAVGLPAWQHRAGPRGSAHGLPVTQPGDAEILGVAGEADVPVVPVEASRDPAAHLRLVEQAPDVLLVACFPRRLPRAVLEVAPWGALNLHPSLLPAYRGPTPLFWQFRQGETRTGVTLHAMEERVDAGPVVARRELAIADGANAEELSTRLATMGAELMWQALAQIARGSLHMTPQDEARASYFPAPRAEDFDIPIEWPARRAFNFVCGTRGWGRAYQIAAGGAVIRVIEALDWSADERLDAAYVQHGSEVRIRFTPGVLTARLASGNSLDCSG